MAPQRTFGYLAEFPNPAALYHACEQVRDAGYRDWDSHSPFPLHGAEKAMGFKWSKVPWFSLVFGFSGAGLAFWLQTWVATTASPLIISGKPLFSWQAFVPITFEVGVLFTAFERFSDDAFFISIEAKDANFDVEGTRSFLTELGATSIELVEEA